MSETDDRPSRSTKDRALLALRTVIRNDGAAYNYTLVATGTFGLLQHLDGPVSTGRVFAFALSAAGLAGAWVAASVVDGTWAWVLASFLASLVYVLLGAVNMAIARYAEERRGEGAGDGSP